MFLGKKKSNGTLRDINIKRRMQLTPKKGLLYDALKDAKKKNILLRHRNVIFKDRLHQAEKYLFEHQNSINKLNNATNNFISSQMRSQCKKPRGRRFTINDKVFAISVFKQSGKAYRLLQNIFALPSKRTMLNLLQKIPFQTGINQKIFEHLKRTVEKLTNPLDKYCSLLFDEISLSAGIQYITNQDRAIGFQDLGNNKTKPLFADKALTFMIRSVRKKFKQPVAFMFTNSTINTINIYTPELVVCIKEVVHAVQSTGLKVISLICDQATTNVAAINILKSQSTITFLKSNTQNRLFGFKLGGDEIVPLFDPPHLLKCMRNNLLIKNLKFIDKNGIERLAKWEHIIKFYELDKNEAVIGDRFSPKLTDAHVYVDKMKKMKVSFAAQIFSQRVGSIMKLLSTLSSKLTLYFKMSLLYY